MFSCFEADYFQWFASSLKMMQQPKLLLVRQLNLFKTIIKSTRWRCCLATNHFDVALSNAFHDQLLKFCTRENRRRQCLLLVARFVQLLRSLLSINQGLVGRLCHHLVEGYLILGRKSGQELGPHHFGQSVKESDCVVS